MTGSANEILARPMRRRSREIVDRAEIDEILHGDRVMHLALAQDDVPFLVASKARATASASRAWRRPTKPRDAAPGVHPVIPTARLHQNQP